MNELALFAGAGGGILGGRLLGWRTVCAVEIDPYARSVLLARQRDGCLDRFPVWDDVRTFNGARWRGSVDVVSGGFPCTDISECGKGKGINGEESGLWSEMSRIIGEVRPGFVFVENSKLLVGRGLARVLGDLAGMGYDAKWCRLGACDAGSNHKRLRTWVLAYTDNNTLGVQGGCKIALPWQPLLSWHENVRRAEDFRNRPGIPEPLIRGTRDGVAHWVDRLAAIGNGQVPAVAALAWNILSCAKD